MKIKDRLQKLLDNEKISSGFFDLKGDIMCNHPEHNPPNHMYIPPGKGYRHVCPSCRKTEIIIPPQISY